MDLIANCCAKKPWWKVAPESHTSEVDKVVKVWATSKSEVEHLEVLLPGPQKRKMPPLTHNVWIRSLLQDGDVEPNPGPLKPVSLNGADVTNAIATVSYYAAERYDITALQELNVVCAKQDTFGSLTTRDGYSCFLACFSDSVDQSGRAICPFLHVVWFFWSVRVIEHPQSNRYCLSHSIFCQYAFHCA